MIPPPTRLRRRIVYAVRNSAPHPFSFFAKGWESKKPKYIDPGTGLVPVFSFPRSLSFSLPRHPHLNAHALPRHARQLELPTRPLHPLLHAFESEVVAVTTVQLLGIESAAIVVQI